MADDTSNRTIYNVIGDCHAGQATTVAWDAGSVFITSLTSSTASWYERKLPSVLEETEDEAISGDAFIR